jgi:hypothetical protein
MLLGQTFLALVFDDLRLRDPSVNIVHEQIRTRVSVGPAPAAPAPASPTMTAVMPVTTVMRANKIGQT